MLVPHNVTFVMETPTATWHSRSFLNQFRAIACVFRIIPACQAGVLNSILTLAATISYFICLFIDFFSNEQHEFLLITTDTGISAK